LASSFFLPSIEYIGLSRCAQPKKCQTSCGGVFVNGWKRISEKKEFETASFAVQLLQFRKNTNNPASRYFMKGVNDIAIKYYC
jgi:hypothetical protein